MRSVLRSSVEDKVSETDSASSLVCSAVVSVVLVDESWTNEPTNFQYPRISATTVFVFSCWHWLSPPVSLALSAFTVCCRLKSSPWSSFPHTLQGRLRPALRSLSRPSECGLFQERAKYSAQPAPQWPCLSVYSAFAKTFAQRSRHMVRDPLSYVWTGFVAVPSTASSAVYPWWNPVHPALCAAACSAGTRP